MQSLTLFHNHTQRFIFYVILLIIGSFNLYLSYLDFKTFKNDIVFQDDFIVENIYKKIKYNIIKIKNTNNIIVFTKINKKIQIQQLDNINIYLITKKITFLKYIKGFYTNSFNLFIYNKTNLTYKSKIKEFIEHQHHNKNISSIYNALFLAIPTNKELKYIFSTYGISHLVAISGFHLGVISIILYFILHIFYHPVHKKYIPYRNKRFDILIVVSIILFIYLIFIDMSPSFLRSFMMYLVGIIFLRNNIKILSFETLFIIIAFILALYPRLFFSLSLWFSIAGVFYIFLYLQYFSKLNKYFSFLFFNFWIFLAMNPISHYVFGTTSNAQLFSPLLTILFTLFYPISLLLHIIGFGYIFDDILNLFLINDINIYIKITPFYFLIIYLITSLFAIRYIIIFYILNFLLFLFSFYLYFNLSF